MTAELYQARRTRATKAEVEARGAALLDIIEAGRPMTVQQVFYQATVRGFVEKAESGYDKVQTDLPIARSVLPFFTSMPGASPFRRNCHHLQGGTRPCSERIMVKMMTKSSIQEYLDELADKGVLTRTGKIKNDHPVYVVHPRVHMLCETNRWTLEEAMDFAKRNPIQ
jgi:hypothetical protein